ncbi:MAG: hypothetical protein Kow0068_15030 [Marinilabiliales bacterium]
MRIRKSNNSIFLLLFLCFIYTLSNSQSCISINFTGFGYHPFDIPNHNIFENSISKNDRLVVEPGFFLSYQKFIILTHTSLQLSSGIYSDAVANFSSFNALYLKRKFYHKYKSSFTLALGCAYILRKKWSEVSGYVPESNFRIGEKFETRFNFTGELTYYYYLSKKSDIDIGIIYGHQYNTFTFFIGYRYWINPNVRFRDCNTCGDKKFNRGRLKTWIKRHIKF